MPRTRHWINVKGGGGQQSRVDGRRPISFITLLSNPETRFWSVGPFMLAYRQTETALEILFIERGERDWGYLMQGGDE